MAAGHHLGGDDGHSEDEAWLSQLQESEEVHPFVLRLFQQRVDPAMVAVHPSQ